MTQDLQAQLDDLQKEADFLAWADEMCRREEEAEDARRALGGYHGPQKPADEWSRGDETAYQSELERLEREAEYDRWYDEEGVYREAEDRALARAYGSPW